MFPAKALKPLIPGSWRRLLREAEAAFSISHVDGPDRLAPARDEAVVTCLVKNGEFYIDQFVDHYLGLGFKHICFLDNGSTDRTLEFARRHRNVTTYRSSLDIGGLQGQLKKKLAERAVPSGWCLDVDIDELFEYPCSDRMSLSRFLQYLNVRKYTAVVTQMLDMFSDRPLSSLADRSGENLKAVHRFYDLSEVTMSSYNDDPLTKAHGADNSTSSPATSLFRGGIRRTVFGVNCLLTKHSLFRTGVGLDLFPQVHYVNRARLADVSAVLLHYKFASNAYDEAAQNQQAFPMIGSGYRRIMETIRNSPDRRIREATSREYRGATMLLNDGFLFASTDYRELASGLVAREPRESSLAVSSHLG